MQGKGPVKYPPMNDKELEQAQMSAIRLDLQNPGHVDSLFRLLETVYAWQRTAKRLATQLVRREAEVGALVEELRTAMWHGGEGLCYGCGVSKQEVELGEKRHGAGCAAARLLGLEREVEEEANRE